MKPKHQCHLYQCGEWLYGTQSWKQWRLLCESIFVLINQRTLTLKNNWNKSFSYETKASMSFAQMRKMSLWCPIMKRKGITMWIHVCPNWQINFNSKKWWKGKLFYENKASISFMPVRRISLWWPIMKKKEITMWIHICPNW